MYILSAVYTHSGYKVVSKWMYRYSISALNWPIAVNTSLLIAIPLANSLSVLIIQGENEPSPAVNDFQLSRERPLMDANVQRMCTHNGPFLCASIMQLPHRHQQVRNCMEGTARSSYRRIPRVHVSHDIFALLTFRIPSVTGIDRSNSCSRV